MHDYTKYNFSEKFADFPTSESLEITMKRVLPYYNDSILPEIKDGKVVFIIAHGNSLRSLVKSIEQMNNQKIIEYEIPTAQPIIYTLDTYGNYIQKEILY